MQEFADTVQTRLGALADSSAKAGLVEKAGVLVAAIAAKQDPDKVAVIARGLAADLLAAYPVPLAPAKAPDLARGAALYAENCASCHGTTGHGDGDAARGLNPPPIVFHLHDHPIGLMKSRKTNFALFFLARLSALVWGLDTVIAGISNEVDQRVFDHLQNILIHLGCFPRHL